MRRIGVRFPGRWTKVYAFEAPNHVVVGDIVRTPESYRGTPGSYYPVRHPPGLGEVVCVGDDVPAYRGDVKRILEVFPVSSRKAVRQ